MKLHVILFDKYYSTFKLIRKVEEKGGARAHLYAPWAPHNKWKPKLILHLVQPY